MEKLTTHTPDYLGIPSSVWPLLGGAPHAGEGVVIGMIDTGIDPNHPSFDDKGQRPKQGGPNGGFNGTCETGRGFPRGVCGGKIAAARYFARGAIANGDFNASRDYATPVMVNGFNYGYASGMAPGAQLAIYKALYSFGGHMSDVVAAIDQAIEDGVHILNLSFGPGVVPTGPSAFLNVLDIQLLLAVKSGVLVVQAVGNEGPSPTSVLSFSPWIVSVAASDTDRKYNNSIELGNGQFLPGSGLAPPTSGAAHLQIAAAGDLCRQNDSVMLMENCMRAEPFVRSLARGKIIVCSYIEMEYITTIVSVVAETMRTVGAAGFILTLDYDLNPSARFVEVLQREHRKGQRRDRDALRGDREDPRRPPRHIHRAKPGRGILLVSGPRREQRHPPTADVLKPTLTAPGSYIWAAWSPESESDSFNKGQHFALLSGTSMAAPHVAGVAALIKQRNPHWTPAMVTSALSTTARGPEILADRGNSLGPAGPFDCGAGFISPARALDPGLVLDARFEDYLRFLCAVPGVDGESVMRAVGTGCAGQTGLPADLNMPSVVVSNLVRSVRVMRRLTNVGGEREMYNVTVREPRGVSVRVAPQVLVIEKDGAEHLRISIRAESAINEFVFGEIMLKGDRGHVVRVPLAIYVTSTLGD
ncbi:hypothetical protein QJS10_CPA10g01023 [Acorus calamus]|uniref:Uncharacterized protein n=1 Tax=Acorus calamus TaxID=4465 RepID=A0AAV9DXP3_ACOCL|nr:hypothetical protein QJS10_CPA10g01023 [Acorus calamus]